MPANDPRAAMIDCRLGNAQHAFRFGAGGGGGVVVGANRLQLPALFSISAKVRPRTHNVTAVEGGEGKGRHYEKWPPFSTRAANNALRQRARVAIVKTQTFQTRAAASVPVQERQLHTHTHTWSLPVAHPRHNGEQNVPACSSV